MATQTGPILRPLAVMMRPIGKTVGPDDSLLTAAGHMRDGRVGALLVVPVAEVARRWGGLTPRGAALTVLAWVLALSCLYEIFEWLLTIVAAGETADRYNGQQGDIWDAQKDMALATLGAIVLLPVLRRSR